MKSIDKLHANLIYGRRVEILATWMARLLPQDASVVDVGAGDGLVSRLIMNKRPDIRIEGLEVLLRGEQHIPIREFDGCNVPYEGGSVDVVMFVDILHHTPNAVALLGEARRVARQFIVLKDHTLNGFLAGPTLRLMDRVGNARHGVNLPYLYWPKAKWLTTISDLQMQVDCWESKIHLYPFYLDWLFGRSLHFVARLRPSSRTQFPCASVECSRDLSDKSLGAQDTYSSANPRGGSCPRQAP
jgi:SAM-dependent methyltransferase